MLVSFVLPLCMWADELTEKAAQELAQQFVSSHNTRKSVPTVTAEGRVSGLYVFNLSNNGGFVIVSNDDQTTPILGFGQSGNIDINDLPDNMRAWLQGYADQIAWLKQNGSDAKLTKARQRTATPKGNVKPLITTHWNQGAPYNLLCPTIDGERTVTGCVATTMAQLMYYHKYPTGACSAIPGYTTSTENKAKESISLDVSGLAANTFDWANMTATYGNTSTDTEKNAVAKLMQYCGAALQMMYGLSSNGGSAAYGEAIPFALKTYFGYDGGVQHCYRKNYSYADWVDLICGELAASRPVALGGQSCGGGHSFICDGYKYESETDYFHINWGWGGSCDEYFVLSVLQPWEQGIGGSSTLDGFSYGQDAVIGIQPPAVGTKDYCLSLEGLRLGDDDATKTSKTYTRDGESGDFTGISLSVVAYDYDYGTNSYDVAVQLVNGSGVVVQTLVAVENQTKIWNQSISSTFRNLSIPSTVANGTYYIKVMSKPSSETAWQECHDGDAYKLTAVISGNTLTINVPIPANVTPTATLEVTGNCSTGSEHTVTATIIGGEGSYNGNVFLRVNNNPIMGKVLNIAAGETVNMTFSYIPSEVGDNEIALYNGRTGGSQIGSATTFNINTFVIANNVSNTANIEKNNGKTTSVKLADRTLYKDGAWNTLCLPFAVSNFSGTPLEGATVKTLTSSDYNRETGVLTLIFSEGLNAIEAGKPYIVKWSSDDDIVNPVFNGVTLKSGFVDFESADGKVIFKGNYSPVTLRGGIKTNLYLGTSIDDNGTPGDTSDDHLLSTLYYPSANRTIGACRAWFELNGISVGDIGGSSVKEFVLNFGEEDDADGIDRPTPDPSRDGGEVIFNLAGQRLQKMQKGINIVNGKKILK